MTRRQAAEARWRLAQPDVNTRPDEAADWQALTPVLTPSSPVTAEQVAELETLRRAAGMSDYQYRNFLQTHWRVDRPQQLNQEQYAAACALLSKRRPTPLAARQQGRAP